MIQMWSLYNILIITDTNNTDYTWLSNLECRLTEGTFQTYRGTQCIVIFPTEKQLTLISLKYGDRLTNIPVTSREIAEMYNPWCYTATQ